MKIHTGKACVHALLNDLTDRRGLSAAWAEIDEQIQSEIADAWLAIILMYANDTGPAEFRPSPSEDSR